MVKRCLRRIVAAQLLVAFAVATPAAANLMSPASASGDADGPASPAPHDSERNGEQPAARSGCLLWLDATSIAPDDAGTPGSAAEKSQLRIWRDRSVHRRHASPPPEAAGGGPEVIGHLGATDGSPAAVRFDGRGTHLVAAGPRDGLTGWTLLAVVRPLANRGGFRAIASAAAVGRNDYVSGFNVDLGVNRSSRLDLVNVEGPGFVGLADVCSQSLDFGQGRVLAVVAEPGEEGVRVFLDGQFVGSRPHGGGLALVEQLVIGARWYDNTGRPPAASGFFEGDIAELRLFDRALGDRQRIDLETHLAEKHARFLAERVPLPASPLPERVPLATGRLFVPGFTITPLPIDLPNINVLAYRHDGTLVAGGYDGTVWLLADRDGDGLEETASEYFRSPMIKAVMGMAVTPPGDPRGEGVFVVSVGRVVFIPDADGDGRGDREQVIAEGWPAPQVSAGGVSDAMGAALAPDGSLFFGLGSADFTNAYLVDPAGNSRYDAGGERGTIQRISPDFSSRTTVCSGIRFPYGMACDASGQLFCTDQEGATWLPNGNPFDELHAIEAGRHYGFPPRHPRHLPHVIDEPSLFDFRPQHQSTCGLLFNEPVNGGPVFGPAWWQGSAIICGESRGRLFRVEIARTSDLATGGFLARGQTVGTLAMMPIDAAVSPRGDLVVACHSGDPDWGSGPAGRGRLFQIRYADPTLPQPRFAFVPSPGELRIVFDRPVPVELLKETRPGSRIVFGRSVSNGDAYEQFRPGYAVVALQETDSRHPLAIHGLQLSPDGQTLILATDPHHAAVPHALALAVGAAGHDRPATDRSIDFAYDLHGIVAEWRDASETIAWSGWLPCIDTTLARQLTAGSPDHDRLWQLVEQPGALRLTGLLDLHSMLRPEVQRDLELDHTLPEETITLSIGSRHTLQMAGQPAEPSLTITAAAATRDFEVSATTGPGFGLTCRWQTAEDVRPRILPLHRFLLPWARPLDEPREPRQPPVELAGGDWERGRQIFFGETAACSRCHALDGRGGWIGPDLSNLRQRDHRAVRRDIENPAAALNPEHLAHVLTLVDGRVVSGVVRPEGDQLLVGQIDGTVHRIAATDVEEMQPAAISIMPTGYGEKLGDEGMRDLLLFLTTSAAPPIPPAAACKGTPADEPAPLP